MDYGVDSGLLVYRQCTTVYTRRSTDQSVTTVIAHRLWSTGFNWHTRLYRLWSAWYMVCRPPFKDYGIYQGSQTHLLIYLWFIKGIWRQVSRSISMLINRIINNSMLWSIKFLFHGYVIITHGDCIGCLRKKKMFETSHICCVAHEHTY